MWCLFFTIFKEDSTSSHIQEQLHVIKYFLTYFDLEKDEEVVKEFTLEELKSLLKEFGKENSPDRDGWMVEFFLFFSIWWVGISRMLWKNLARRVFLLNILIPTILH